MSRLRMSVDGLGGDEERHFGNGNGAHPAEQSGDESGRPPTPQQEFITTLETPPSSVTPPVGGGAASVSPYTLSPGMASWQTPRHASIHQNAARLRERSESTARSPSPFDTSVRSKRSRSVSRQSVRSTDGPAVGHLFKVLVVGNAGVGKTSIIKRYAHNVFSDSYQSTIGVDFALKVLRVGSVNGGPEEIVRLQLWDIAGQEQFGAMTRVYYKGAVGAFVVFDLSNNEDGGESVRGWKQDIDDKVRMPNGANIPVVLLGSKCDLVDRRQWSVEEIDRLCEMNGFKHWFEISAKTKVNVTEANSYLVTLMLKMEAAKEADDRSVYTVASANELVEGIIVPDTSKLNLERNPELTLDESCCV